jgi:tetratricopeptide (TPR) repeat protein
VQLHRPDDALAAFDEALALDEQFAQAWACRGGLLKDMGRPAQAIASLQRGIELGADVPVNSYLLASLTGTAAPGSAPAAYVQQLFDAYAGQFETHLVQSLDYRVPELLAQLATGTAGLFHKRWISAAAPACAPRRSKQWHNDCTVSTCRPACSSAPGPPACTSRSGRPTLPNICTPHHNVMH